ncbi:phosphatidylethanolamine-binding protein [Kockiozyma suomiensis]|uniref:phosphatidylethanolamine-binding protein n=1 Tax=Kockiozyma suomiensis TaxID=1337062 RepID=UPI0033437EF9
MPRLPGFVSQASRASLRAASTATSSIPHSASPSFADELDPKSILADKDLSTIARAIGCSADDLTAFPNPTVPAGGEPLITARQLTMPAAMRPPFLDWRVQMKPASLKSKKFRNTYLSPIGLDGAFREALEILGKDRDTKYVQVLKLQSKVDAIKAQFGVLETNEITDIKARSEAYLIEVKIEKLRILAELSNPEVIAQFERGRADMQFPVYRYLARKKWEQIPRAQLVDRLENMHVIPDTMPYIKPTVDLRVRFPGPTAYWFDPGRILSTAVTAQVPEFQINTFEDKTSRYTIVIVDPDTPDFANDSYKSTLHYILSDIEIHGNKPDVDTEASTVVVPYLPPHPEKNSGIHRYAVWLFEQPDGERLAIRQRGSKEIDNSKLLDRDEFDIRLFRSAYGLKAVGAHLWRNKYDSQTEAVREKFGLGQGTVWSRARIQHY